MILFLFSGKRKSGKDYIADLFKKQNPEIQTYQISAPLKIEYALQNGLNYQELLTSSNYKEQYRSDMVKFGEDKRKENPFYFCEKIKFKSLEQLQMNVVSDVRRKTDILYFKNTFEKANPKIHKVVTIRIVADLATRESRGFVFDENIDNQETECDLDEYEFDFVVENNQDSTEEYLVARFLGIFEEVMLELEDQFEFED